MTAQKLGSLNSKIHRIELGDFEVTMIQDGALKMGVSPPFLLDESDDTIARIAHQSNLPDDALENNFTPVVVNTGDALVLIDTGLGHGGHSKGAGLLHERLFEAGYPPENIDIVVLTHVHPDHIGGLLQDGELAFPNAQLMIGRREFDAWKAGDEIPPQRHENREMFMKIVAPLQDHFRFLDDGDQIARGITAEAAFGHSLGHIMFRLNSAGQSALIWGDIANHYVFSIEHPNSKVGFDDDKDMAIATRNRVLNEAAESGVLIIGHHMPFPSIGYVQRAGDSFRWAPASYQLRV